MGLMLSVLVFCVGVLEALSCLEYIRQSYLPFELKKRKRKLIIDINTGKARHVDAVWPSDVPHGQHVIKKRSGLDSLPNSFDDDDENISVSNNIQLKSSPITPDDLQHALSAALFEADEEQEEDDAELEEFLKEEETVETSEETTTSTDEVTQIFKPSPVHSTIMASPPVINEDDAGVTIKDIKGPLDISNKINIDNGNIVIKDKIIEEAVIEQNLIVEKQTGAQLNLASSESSTSIQQTNQSYDITKSNTIYNDLNTLISCNINDEIIQKQNIVQLQQNEQIEIMKVDENNRGFCEPSKEHTAFSSSDETDEIKQRIENVEVENKVKKENILLEKLPEKIDSTVLTTSSPGKIGQDVSIAESHERTDEIKQPIESVKKKLETEKENENLSEKLQDKVDSNAIVTSVSGKEESRASASVLSTEEKKIIEKSDEKLEKVDKEISKKTVHTQYKQDLDNIDPVQNGSQITPPKAKHERQVIEEKSKEDLGVSKEINKKFTELIVKDEMTGNINQSEIKETDSKTEVGKALSGEIKAHNGEDEINMDSVGVKNHSERKPLKVVVEKSKQSTQNGTVVETELKKTVTSSQEEFKTSKVATTSSNLIQKENNSDKVALKEKGNKEIVTETNVEDKQNKSTSTKVKKNKSPKIIDNKIKKASVSIDSEDNEKRIIDIEVVECVGRTNSLDEGDEKRKLPEGNVKHQTLKMTPSFDDESTTTKTTTTKSKDGKTIKLKASEPKKLSTKQEMEKIDDPTSPDKAFWLIFSGEYTKAMSKDWHSGHFCCWQCDESLTGQRYVLRDDHPYCIKCYESVFANTCDECNKTIGIDSKDLSYKDKHWHEACFFCNKCRVSLVDKQFGSKADKIYCGNCYDAQFASRCDGCGQIFRAGTKKMEYKTRQWHEQCFCCCVCKTPIGTKSFIPREQEIYCATCYEEKFATRCVKCNKIITSGGVTYKNEPWHRECFTCTNCNTSLAGQRFTSREEKPYCADCFGELFAKRCTACCKPITGIGGTRFISFEDRHWHNDCFICAACKSSLVGRGFITDAEDILCTECAKQKLM